MVLKQALMYIGKRITGPLPTYGTNPPNSPDHLHLANNRGLLGQGIPSTASISVLRNRSMHARSRDEDPGLPPGSLPDVYQ